VTRLEEEARIGESGALASQLSRLNLVVLDELGYLPFARSGGQPSAGIPPTTCKGCATDEPLAHLEKRMPLRFN
jgi:hypothetical protein